MPIANLCLERRAFGGNWVWKEYAYEEYMLTLGMLITAGELFASEPYTRPIDLRAPRAILKCPIDIKLV